MTNIENLSSSDELVDHFEQLNDTIEESTADIITNFALPIVSFISLFMTLLCVSILSRSIFKCSFYKYLLFNSIFESFALVTVIIRSFLKTALTEQIHELYIFFYITTSCLTCSNIIKILISFERYSKMTGKYRFIFKKLQSNLIIIICVLLGLLINLPDLILHDYFEFEWFKLTYNELSLSLYGNNNSLGSFLLIKLILFNISVPILLVFFNALLKKAIKENLKKLTQLIKNESKKTKEFVITILNDIDDIKEYENDDMSEIELDKVSVRNVKLNDTISQEVDMEKLESNQKKKTAIEIEKARKKLCDMISFSSQIFIVGHFLNFACSSYEQIMNLINRKDYEKIQVEITDQTDTIGIVYAVSNLILYLSLGLNFFIYFYFNATFRYFVEKAFKNTFKCLFSTCLNTQIVKQEKNEKSKI